MDNIASILENFNVGMLIMNNLEAWRFILIWGAMLPFGMAFLAFGIAGIIKAIKQ